MNEELLDALLDLRHDLGKYLVMPLSFLSDGATSDEIREAIRRALFETRVSRSEVRGARRLWEDFTAEIDATAVDDPHYATLRDRVTDALAWEAAPGDGRAALDGARADFTAVGTAIDDWISALRDA